MKMNYKYKIAPFAIIVVLIASLGCIGGGTEKEVNYNSKLKAMLESNALQQIPSNGLLALGYIKPEGMQGIKHMAMPMVMGSQDDESSGVTGMATAMTKPEGIGVGIFFNKPVGVMTVIDFDQPLDISMIKQGFPDAEETTFMGKKAFFVKQEGLKQLVYVKGSDLILLTGSISLSPEQIQSLDNPKELVKDFDKEKMEDFLQENDESDFESFVVSGEDDARLYDSLSGKSLSGFFAMNVDLMVVSGAVRGSVFSGGSGVMTFTRADSILTQLVPYPEEGESVLVAGNQCKKTTNGKTSLFCKEGGSVYWSAFEPGEENKARNRISSLFS